MSQKPSEKPFPLTGHYKKTGMKTYDGHKIFVETNYNEEARKNGMMRFTIDGSKQFTVKVLDLISNLMAHAEEEQARYMSDGLMHKTKKKHIIDYPFYVRLQKPHMPGELLECNIQIEVPEELLDTGLDIQRKHIAHEGKSGHIITAPKGAGQLPKSNNK